MIQIDIAMPTDCASCWIRKNMGCKIANKSGWLNNKRDDNCPLKEKDAVKPYVDIDEAKCPICKVRLTRQELLGDDVLFEDFFDYCPHCGRSVKWE